MTDVESLRGEVRDEDSTRTVDMNEQRLAIAQPPSLHNIDDSIQDADKGSMDTDADIVDWDGPDDPANPRNWCAAYKFINIGLISASVLYCNIATTMFAPAANVMQQEFGFDNSAVEILTITIASLGFAAGPLFIAPLSEVFGRIPIYRAAAVCYLGFTVGCSRSTHVAEFLVLRLLTGLSASPFMTTGGGTIADLLEKEKRGGAMAIFTVGPIIGPILGPIAGGFLTDSMGWRWTFYVILMLAGFVSVASFILMRETCAPVILRAKAARLRKETGNTNLRAAGDSQIPVSQLVARALRRPTTFLVKSPIVLLTSVYIAFIFGVAMLFYSTFPIVYEQTYHWSVGVSGLAYLGVGVGCTIGILMFAKLSDRLLRNGTATPRKGEFPPERRMLLVIYFCPLIPVGLFIYGWTAEYAVHWIVPIIGTAITGMGVVVVQSSCQTYIIDVFGPASAASALSAVTLLRNILGGCLPLAGPALYENLGLGWGNSVLAFISVAFIAVPFGFYWRGQWLRERFPVKS